MGEINDHDPVKRLIRDGQEQMTPGLQDELLKQLSGKSIEILEL